MGRETPTAASVGPTQEGPAATPTPDYAAIIEQDLQGVIEASRAEALKYSPASSTAMPGASALPAVRIRIPVVGIDSDIKELEIIDNGDSRAWETPKHIVGHIPTTGVPGDRGHGWYFGHLESPFSGEGNVFGRLPDLAKLFTDREDSPFYVFLESEDLKFVYQIYRTEIVHSDDFGLQDLGESDITLVTCYPRFTYDLRLLVTAALVGVRES
jgi:sortase (surface protein transpeptidase)